MYRFIQHVYDRLLDRWGPQHWWPAETRWEMMVGAVLTQNTAWTNVEKAIWNLRRDHMLDLEALHAASAERIADLIRPAGYFNQKAVYIKAMAAAINDRFNGSLNALFALDTPTLRRELLSWKGIGPETADCILLYAARRPVFVVDAYTKRFLVRHGWCNDKSTYHEIAKLFTDHLPNEVPLFNEYHALIVQLGKEHCRTKPHCEGCPLERFIKK